MEIRKSPCWFSGGSVFAADHRHCGLLNGAELDFSLQGGPTDNAFIQVFNGRLGQKHLNESWFPSL